MVESWLKFNSVLLLTVLPLSFGMPIVFATSYANLHLDTVGDVRVGENIIFSGQLTSLNGSVISHRTIFIEDDTSYIRPDIILAISTTNSDGKFLVSWKSVPKDNGTPFHFYAKFLGGKTFGYTRSETFESYLLASNTYVISDVVPSKTMPAWFKSASKMWHDGQIRDVDYSYAINNLIDYGIIHSSVQVNSELKFPSWLKNDAEWFEEGKISNDDYSNALGYLLDNKLIKI